LRWVVLCSYCQRDPANVVPVVIRIEQELNGQDVLAFCCTRASGTADSVPRSLLQVLRLTALAADASAPAAAILAGQGTRPGLLQFPVAVACSLDRIVVLQTSDDYPQGGVCAFDVKGNPVNCFTGGASVTGLHPEGTATVVVADLSIESKGYLYILKYLEPASGQVLASDYRLDIYNPDGTFLAQVPGLAAAWLHVDLWRNLFTLNYEILAGSGRSKPSVAQWIPSTPGT
jgi:hypothetical protein